MKGGREVREFRLELGLERRRYPGVWFVMCACKVRCANSKQQIATLFISLCLCVCVSSDLSPDLDVSVSMCVYTSCRETWRHRDTET